MAVFACPLRLPLVKLLDSTALLYCAFDDDDDDDIDDDHGPPPEVAAGTNAAERW